MICLAGKVRFCFRIGGAQVVLKIVGFSETRLKILVLNLKPVERLATLYSGFSKTLLEYKWLLLHFSLYYLVEQFY